MRTPNDYIRKMAEEGKFGKYFLTLIVSEVVIIAILLFIVEYVIPEEMLHSAARWITIF